MAKVDKRLHIEAASGVCFYSCMLDTVVYVLLTRQDTVLLYAARAGASIRNT